MIIHIYDSIVYKKDLRNLVVNTAEKNDIPFQYSTMAGGGTDSGSIHLTHNGVPALSITIATRYIHSNAAVLHRDDFENAVKLIVEVIKNFDQKQLEDVRKA